MSELRTSRVINQQSADFDNITLDTDGSTRFALADGGGGTPVLFVNKDNNRVGINDADPDQALDVSGNFNLTGNAVIGGTLNATGNVTFGGDIDITGDLDVNEITSNTDVTIDTNGRFDANVPAGGSAVFVGRLNGTQTSIIDGNGSVAFSGSFVSGATSAAAGNACEITDSSAVTTLAISKRGNQSNILPVAIYNDATAGDSNLVGFYGEVGGSTNLIGRIFYDRAAGQVVYSQTSDRRLKKNIKDSESALDTLANIKVRSYELKDNNNKINFGFIAQELYESHPLGVGKGDDEETIKQVWGVDYSKLVPLLTKGLQEALKKIETLETRIATLENS